MIISDERRFILVAVPKTATTSIEDALSPHGAASTRAGDGKHRTASEIRAEVGADKWDRYLTFAFVRHPLDWVVSWYTYRAREELRDPLHPNHHRSTADVPFDAFVRERMWSEKCQSDYVFDDDDNLLVDFLGRFEKLDADFATVCQRIGIDVPDLPARNKSPDGDYSNLYTDELRRIVFDENRRDFTNLGYDQAYEWAPSPVRHVAEEVRTPSRVELLARKVRRTVRRRG